MLGKFLLTSLLPEIADIRKILPSRNKKGDTHILGISLLSGFTLWFTLLFLSFVFLLIRNSLE